MASAELVCTCNAALQLDLDDEAALLALAVRFINMHVGCGYVTPVELPEATAVEDTHLLTIKTSPPDKEEEATK